MRILGHSWDLMGFKREKMVTSWYTSMYIYIYVHVYAENHQYVSQCSHQQAKHIVRCHMFNVRLRNRNHDGICRTCMKISPNGGFIKRGTPNHLCLVGFSDINHPF